MGVIKIEYLELDKLVPYVNNPKTHPEEQIDKIAGSIKEFGFINPIIIDKENSIVAGHGRILAARKIGLEKVPIIRLENLTPAQIKAYRLADNRLNESEWDMELVKIELEGLKELDFDLNMTGFDINNLEKEEIKEYPEKEFDENIKTENECPKCGYKW